MSKIYIKGIKIDALSKKEVFGILSSYLKDSKKHFVVTVNPEFIVDSLDNLNFKKALNNADLSLPDGYGLLFAAKYLHNVSLSVKVNPLLKLPIYLYNGLKTGIYGFINASYLDIIPERIAGSDLIYDLFTNDLFKNSSFYLIGTKYHDGRESAKEAFELLQKQFTNVKFVGHTSGRQEYSKGNFDYIENSTIKNSIKADLVASNLDKVDFLLVAFGHIRQETWIDANLNELPCKVAIGVGGALDFVRGEKKRAPLAVRNLKLEWLFRLLMEPTKARAVRIFKAFPYFSYIIFKDSLGK